VRAELPRDIRLWPAATPLWPSLGIALPVGRAKAYELASQNALPFVRKLGSRYLIVTSQLMEYLGLEKHEAGTLWPTVADSAEVAHRPASEGL
jgi:excisionase family DNA binding protein